MNALSYDDLKEGDVIVADAGFDCIKPGEYIVKDERGELFIDCCKGRHWLDGSRGAGGLLVGFIRKNG